MAGLPPITVRQPRPHDLVDDPVGICGIGTGFEGTITARLRARNGQELARVPISAGGTGTWGNFQAKIGIPGSPPTPRGMLEIFEEAQDGSGRELNKVTVPIVFGTNLIGGYVGFHQYEVQNSDTLSSIAEQVYGDSGRFRVIFEANRDRIEDPDIIFPGQVLRVPIG